MFSIEEYISSIRNSYPDFQINSAQLNYQGQNSDVLIVNGEWIFRFPKFDHVLARFQTETVLLKTLQRYLPLPIPSPKYVQLEKRSAGQAFMGYRFIPGEPLMRDTFQEITAEPTIEALAEQLSGFLGALHNFPVRDYIQTDLSVMDTHEEWLDIYERIRDRLFAYMRPDACQLTQSHFEDYLDEEANFFYRPVLKHSDFGTSNILFDPIKERISGIIDFSYAGMGDPAYDFAGLLSSYGESFIERCEQYYPDLMAILPRVRFYQGTFALYEALFGIENGDEAAFNAGMASYV